MGSNAIPHLVSNASTVKLSSFQFNDQDILKIIIALHVNKAHGCDDISVCMIKICDQSIVKPLSMIYQNCLNTHLSRHLEKIKHCFCPQER